MKKITLLLFSAILLQFAVAQVHTFKTIAFVDGGTISSCSFAAETFMFNGNNYTSFPGFGLTNTTAARGNHSHTGTYVTSVTAAAPVVSTGGMTPVISMPISDEVTDGYLSKENFNIFFGRVKSVSAILPLQCSGGTEPELQILRASESENGYLSFKDFTTFNSKVSSQWIDGSGLIYLPSGKCGIGLTNPTYTFDVSGTANINDFKSTGSYISRITAAAGNSVISGIWSDGTTPGPGGGNISNHSVYASAADGSYFYYYNNPPAYNYQVGIFDNTGERKAFIGKMGGSAPTQPYVNLGSSNFPWGKGYYADTMNTKSILVNGNIGIGTTSPSSPLHIVNATQGSMIVDGYRANVGALAAASKFTMRNTFDNNSMQLTLRKNTDNTTSSILTTYKSSGALWGEIFHYNLDSYLLQVGANMGTAITSLQPAGIGKVGILTTTPDSAFQVSGSSHFTGNMKIDGKISIGTTNATNTINFDGTAARKIGVNQNTNTAVPGSSLTLEAGNCAPGYANKWGGSLIFNGGLGTGNAGSDAVFNLSQRAAAGGGTTHNALMEVARISGQGGFTLNSNYIYYPQIIITAYNDASAPYMNFQHAGGTMAAPTNVAIGSSMGSFIWRARLRGVFTNTASFGAIVVDTAINVGSAMPSSQLNFSTTNKNNTQNSFYMNEVGYFGISPAGAYSNPTTFLDIGGDKFRLRSAKTPASATAAGNQGDICWDAGFIYVCVATNSWKKIAIATW